MNKCIICGKEFEVDKQHLQQNTCSLECKMERKRQVARKSHTKRRNKAREARECKLCGAIFKAEPGQRICLECKHAIYREAKYNTAEPPKPKKAITLDDLLKDAKKCGFEPYEYGKYKTMKTLEKVPRIGGTI